MKTNTIIIILCSLLILIIIAMPAGPLWLTNATYPIRSGVANLFTQASGYVHWFGDVRKLTQERDELAIERNKLLAEVSELEAVERENEALRSQIGAGKKIEQSQLLARTAGIIEKGSAKYLLLNKGEADGVKVGNIVTVNQVLVGRISEAASRTSLVELPLTSGAIIPVVIRYESGVTKGVVVPSFNLTARLEQVLQSERLQEGETLLTSGEGGTFPPDIVVGKVGKKAGGDQEVFQSASVELLWNINELETVFIRQP